MSTPSRVVTHPLFTRVHPTPWGALLGPPTPWGLFPDRTTGLRRTTGLTPGPEWGRLGVSGRAESQEKGQLTHPKSKLGATSFVYLPVVGGGGGGAGGGTGPWTCRGPSGSFAPESPESRLSSSSPLVWSRSPADPLRGSKWAVDPRHGPRNRERSGSLTTPRYLGDSGHRRPPVVSVRRRLVSRPTVGGRVRTPRDVTVRGRPTVRHPSIVGPRPVSFIVTSLPEEQP